jgi:molecular chaperone DnaJ
MRRSGGISIRTECSGCGGTGRKPPEACPACNGSGIGRRISDISVRVPPGVDTGAKLHIPLPGGAELIGVVKASEHALFTRDGSDLRLRVPVTIAEAALGAVLTVPTLDAAVTIRLPPGTAHGKTLRVRGRGIRCGDRAGDLLVTIEVVIPSELSESQRASLEAFAAATESPRRHLE